MIEGLKPFYNSVLSPVAKILAKAGIHPNAITVSGVALSGAAAYFCAVGHWPLAALLVFCGSCMDGLDGLVSRETGKQTRFGAVLDSVADRVTETAWFFGLLLYYAANPTHGGAGIYLAFLAHAGSQMVSYVRARCEGAGIACKEGILQRPERIVIIIACLLLGPAVMMWGLGIIAVLGFATALQRCFVAWRAGNNR
ncbi:MAG TPA: CDP-alcohol phosphatidyltransferase family protein [Chitinivibrionales bacterium]|nr:CDP-alcohol phosphatidyltransferase family protein [Chitinivibrionales bacterium]